LVELPVPTGLLLEYLLKPIVWPVAVFIAVFDKAAGSSREDEQRDGFS
jgi:hypothetical protein